MTLPPGEGTPRICKLAILVGHNFALLVTRVTTCGWVIALP
jgi:hypothetical protein